MQIPISLIGIYTICSVVFSIYSNATTFNEHTYRGCNSFTFIFVSFFNRGQPIQKRNCSSCQKQILSFRKKSFKDGLNPSGKQAGNVVSLYKHCRKRKKMQVYQNMLKQKYVLCCNIAAKKFHTKIFRIPTHSKFL